MSLPLVAIVGPTASGKSSLGVALSERFGGEVLACDSTQVYRGFDIGTAKPLLEERRGVAHHLMDIAELDQVFSAGDYRRRALETLADLRSRGALPILTAGTGLYLRALLDGMADAPQRSEELRRRLAASAARHGSGHLHALLARLDAEAAARIAANDRQKLVRAIEICVMSGRPITDVHRAGREPLEGYSGLKIGLNPPRAELYQRIEARTRSMVERGWLRETADLIVRDASGSTKALEFIGYGELRAHLEGAKTLKDAMAAIAQATRRYAKRQLTWFRKEPAVVWFAGFGDDPAIGAAVASAVAAHLDAVRGVAPSSLA